MSSSSKSTATRVSKTPLDHLKSKKWCFPPSTTASAASGQSSSPRLLSPSKSPEPNCAICLGKIEDKSFTDRCFHCFCRLCLFEWSKVKAECPVCRQAFEKIIYNIRAMDDYDEQLIQTGHRHRFGHFHSPFGYHPFANLDGNQRFRYPTTLTPLRRRMMDFERRIQLQLQMTEFTPGFQSFPQFLHMIDNRRVRDQRLRSSAISNAINNNNNSLRNSSANQYSPSSSRTSGQGLALNERHRFRGEDPMISGQSSRTWNPNNYYANPFELDMYPPPAGTTAHRRYIYDSDLWVLTNGDGNTSRTREVTARFFSSNPACTHRLIPWLNRELNSILDNTNETETLIPRIMNALLMYDITSIGFKKIIAPFTHHKTNHFIHEFYNFARSPYDMEQYTRNAVYVPRHRADIVESEPLPGPIGYAVEADDSPPHLSPRYVLQSPESISSSTSGSSIEIIDEPFSRSTNRRRIPCPGPQRMSPDIFSIDGSDSDESSTEIRQLITPSPVNTPSLHEERDQSEAPDTKAVSAVSNPTPLPRGDLPDVNFRNIDIIDDFDNPKPGTSGLSRMRTTAQTKWSDSDTDVDVGDELEAAIARFEQNCKPEVKTETTVEKMINVSNNNGNDSDSSCSSVLIVGYVKPLHERTPEFVNLISTDEQIDDSIEGKVNTKAKKLKKSRKLKHRKRSSGRSRSGSQSRTPVPSASHSKRKHRHKSRSRDEEKDRSRHRHRSHRMSRHYRTDTSSSSSDSSSNSDELKQLTKSFRKREHKYRTHRKHSSDSKRFRWSPSSRESRYFEANRDTTAATTTTSASIPVPSLTSSSRPSSLGSVVIRKQPLEWPPLRHYSVYSDSD